MSSVITEKTFYIQNNIGKSKYVINFHDGIKKHKDGSDFYDVVICKNNSQLNQKIKDLIKEGYNLVIS